MEKTVEVQDSKSNQKNKKQTNSNEVQQMDESKDAYAFIDLFVLKDIVSKEGAYAMLVAYVVICFGLNNKKSKSIGRRISTHGINSILNKTNLTKGEAETAVQLLIDAGYIIDLRIGEKYVKDKPTFEIINKGGEKDLVAVDSRFVQTTSAERDVWTLNYLLGDAALNHPTRHCFYSSLNESRLDILYVFFHLLKKQNIDNYSGLDPAFFGSICNKVNVNDFIAEFNNSIEEVGELYLCDIRQTFEKFSMCRIVDILEAVVNPESDDLEGRAKYVMEILVRAKLVNRVVTLWRSNSNNLSSNKLLGKKSIVATVGIENFEGQKIKGNFILSEMLIKLKEVDERMAFGVNGNVNREDDSVLSGKKKWLCFVRRELSEKFFLCDHLRVAYLAGTNDNIKNLESEERRNNDYIKSLSFI